MYKSTQIGKFNLINRMGLNNQFDFKCRQWRIQDFQKEGVQKIAHIPSPLYDRGPGPALFWRALEATEFYMLSHAIWALFWSVLINGIKKNIVDQFLFFWGGDA